MKKSLKNKWIKALTSGEFTQGTVALHKVDEAGNATYCCLGVLCVVAEKRRRKSRYPGCYAYGGCDVALSPKFLKEFGITSETQDKLIRMNDSTLEGKSFKQIAAYIKRYL